MNAIVLCTGRAEELGLAGVEGPRCLFDLAGQPVLAYVLAGLARLSLTRIVFVLGPGARRVKSFIGLRLPLNLVRFVSYSDDAPPDSLAALAEGLKGIQNTGLLVIGEHCLFDPELVEAVVNRNVAALAYRQKIQVSRREEPVMLLRLAGESIQALERGIPTEESADIAADIWYVPHAYLPILRGITVELLASGAGHLHHHEILRTMLARGIELIAANVTENLYAELHTTRALPYATSVALELQRRGGVGGVLLRKAAARRA